MPWQQYVADVVLEIDPDTGRLAYQEFGLTVPRQSGKSTFVLAKATHRCSATKFFGNRQRLVYTAQTRGKAREKWEEDFVADLESSSFKARISVHKGNGNEHVRFQNGSKFGIEASTEKAGHGGTLDEAYIDEAFAQADSRLEQAFGPAMITRRNKQLGWISTAGWLQASPYLEDKIKVGRAAVQGGRTTGLAYFEWSADPGADPGDPATWWGCMPALGLTIQEADIRHEYEKARDAGKLNDFKRAYCNLWVPKDMDVDDPMVGRWLATADPGSSMETVSAIGVDTSPDRAFTSLGAAGPRKDGKLHVELVPWKRGSPDFVGRGTGWVVDRCVELDREHGPLTFIVDGKGPASTLIDDLRGECLSVVTTSLHDMAVACGDMVDALEQGTVAHGPQDDLDDAVKAMKRRSVGDGPFAFGRKVSTANISPLVAVTLAKWGHENFGDATPSAFVI